ncbi:oxidoreductase domain-containing protein [Thermoanaerobacter kivui]|uniref:Oxidoreductase domain-containing protein n=1 Tax=Thermoanaerobacter kivui TaxID=2325 RepID=A0A097ASZ5_THEKI|nr:oxidoreductase domain-containing protein [Thermoanaerobacter kivui]
MVEAYKKTGKKLTIGYQNRFRPDSQYLHKVCQNGELGEIYFAKAHAIRRLEIVAISDPDIEAAKRLAEKYNIPHVYTDYEEMFEKEKLDLISVCTPNYLHAPISIKAMEKGIHVHCEKPITLNAKEAYEVIESKNKYKRKFMIGLNNRFTNESF